MEENINANPIEPIEEIQEVKLEEEAQQDCNVNTGTVKISDEVISVVAGITVGEIKGVTTAGSSFAEIFGAKKNVTKGVRVNTNGKDVVIDLYVTVVYGVKIPDISWEIQEKVKNAVESMTGMNVLKVNIHVEGVDFEKEIKKESAPKSTPQASKEESKPEEPKEVILEDITSENVQDENADNSVSADIEVSPENN